MLTENSPIGMLTLSSMASVVIDFYPLGTYQDPLYEIKEYVTMCNRRSKVRDKNIIICNSSPWSDMVLSDPTILDKTSHDRHQDVFELKQQIYTLCGWAPDVIINIYDKAPDPRWRKRISLLCDSDPELTVVSLNASDPNFSKNLCDAIDTLAYTDQQQRRDTAIADRDEDEDEDEDGEDPMSRQRRLNRWPNLGDEMLSKSY